ncbi:MAG TPA: biotin carboxylase N-terminal domain-containing protein [Pseudonocardiaceae bacterium]|nr:biotin carboxylase N-terminal domain-containing protein [Pseudonocardiaceae bacterium]
MRKLLVANRGEIASRVIRTARAMDIETVAVFSDPDADLPFTRDADEAVRLPGSAPGQTYLRADAVIAAATSTGADAVHPGYGFLSENADFARACAAAGLTFVGPTPEAIEAMGSKIAAKRLMAAAGVPVLRGAVFDAADEPDPAALRAAAEEIGLPVLVKAAFGGGGRGMRIVHDADEVVDAVAGSRREAASAFGDGTVFLERFVASPRHIEVQIVGDQAGNVVHLFERECSIQRRYQKIIEEAPSPVVGDELRAELCRAAVAAGKAIGYVGAGTVEFVLDADGRFYFLEVNTRLQVEHPVTELITGVDLVRVQIDVANGHPLPPNVTGATYSGHAIEARLYAEDAPAGYLPTSGDLHTFEIEPVDGLRVDAGFASGTRISTFYDSMLAKVIGYGPTREQARQVLAGALARARLHGVVTNRDLLVGILREAGFRAAAIDTGYLDRHPPAELCRTPDDTTVRVHAVAAALAGQAARRAAGPVLATLPTGWRNNPSAPQTAAYDLDGRRVDVSYRVSPAGLVATVDGVEATALLHGASPSEVDVEIDGTRRRIAVTTVGNVSYVDSVLGHSAFAEVDRFPDPTAVAQAGSLLAPMPGTVVRVDVAVGDHVPVGASILAIEAMKMEHTIRSPAAGVVAQLAAAVGAQVESGSVLAVLDEEGDQ